MKRVDLNKQENIEFLLYPDNQPHVTVKNIYEGDDVCVVCSLMDSIKLVQLLQTANAIDNLFAKKKQLVIPYLMAARYDRLMVPGSGESFDLKVIATLINSMNFERVYLYDVHSEVSLALINNCVNVPNIRLVMEYSQPDSVLIVPDAGATKKAPKYFEWNKNLTDTVQCVKKRDLTNGNLFLTVLEPEKCADRNCVIIDDLCDGGGTFLAIASQIKAKRLTLIVTHGIFSKGTKLFNGIFDEIIVSDSYYRSCESGIVKIIDLIL